jgi:hypothetical protein
VESILGPLGTAAITGLLYLPRLIVRMEKLVEWTVLAGESEVLGGNLPRHLFFPPQIPLARPGHEPGPPRWKPPTNRFSYGAASKHVLNYARFSGMHPRIKCDNTVIG